MKHTRDELKDRLLFFESTTFSVKIFPLDISQTSYINTGLLLKREGGDLFKIASSYTGWT